MPEQPKQPEQSSPDQFVPSPRRRGPGRLWKALTARPDGGQVVVAVLVGALGFGAVLQVRADEEDQLGQARRTDLVQILSDLNQRGGRLESELGELQATQRELASGADSEEAALEQTAARARQLAVLAGTEPASGPGVEVTIEDPGLRVAARHILSAIGELRVAGAEAMQIAGGNGNVVRIAASSYFLDIDGELEVDGVQLTRPYLITAVGDPNALAESVQFAGGTKEIVEEAVAEMRDEVLVDALRDPAAPQYARPTNEDE